MGQHKPQSALASTCTEQQEQLAAYLGHTAGTSQQDLEQQFLQSRRALAEFAAELSVVQQSLRESVVNDVSRRLHHTASPHIWCEPGGAHLGGSPVTGKERIRRLNCGTAGRLLWWVHGRRKRWEFGVLHEHETKSANFLPKHAQNAYVR